MGAREASIFACLADCFLDPEPLLPRVCETDALKRFDQWLARTPRHNQIVLRIVLRLIDLVPLVLGGGGCVRRLQLDSRRLWLMRVERLPVRPLREPIRTMKSMMLLYYYSDPAVWAGLGLVSPSGELMTRDARANDRP